MITLTWLPGKSQFIYIANDTGISHKLQYDQMPVIIRGKGLRQTQSYKFQFHRPYAIIS